MGLTAETSPLETRRDWRGAFAAIRKLLANGSDTTQVFVIMRALNAGAAKANYLRLIDTKQGGRIAFSRVEMLDRLADMANVESFAPGTFGAAYRAWLEETGHTAAGLAEISARDHADASNAHPYAWSGRRVRDIHDLWHVLTGYKADEDFGEICLVAFSYAQTGGLGWAFIAGMSALKHLRDPYGRKHMGAVWEGYQLGRKANWLIGEDFDQLLSEPLEKVRIRLGIGRPIRYLANRDAIATARQTAR
jgi:ubiquinone biosynthesis protein COQ4